MGKNSKRKNPIMVYLTDDELEQFQKLAKGNELNQSECIRRKIFDIPLNEQKPPKSEAEILRENIINIQRQNFVISKLLIMVSSDVNRNELIADKPIPEKAKTRILNYLDHITKESEKTFK